LLVPAGGEATDVIGGFEDKGIELLDWTLDCDAEVGSFEEDLPPEALGREGEGNLVLVASDIEGAFGDVPDPFKDGKPLFPPCELPLCLVDVIVPPPPSPPESVVLSSGGLTDVLVGVMIVVIYATNTNTVGALVTVTRWPLWKGSRMVLVAMKSL
jgi:hypothetical protein